MAWTDSIKVIKTGIAWEETAGTAATQPQEYIYINSEGVLNCPREFSEFFAHGSRSKTFSVPKPYHTTGSYPAWVFPETNGFGQWLVGAIGADTTPVKHGTLAYIHSATITDTQIPSWTWWMKTGVYEYCCTNCQINRLVINQPKADVLQATADIFGSQLTNTSNFGSAVYVTDANDAFTSQKAYALWDDVLMTNMSDLSITIDNGIDPNEPKILGKAYADHILAGNRNVTGSGTLFVESGTEIADYWGSATGPAATTTTIPLRFTWWSDTIETDNTQTTAVQELKMTGSTATLTPGGTCDDTTNPCFFEVKTTTAAAADKFQWRKNWGAWSAEVEVTGAAQTLSNAVTITFGGVSDGVVGDRWWFYSGVRPYVLDVHIPAARITAFEQQSVGNRLSARVDFSAQISSSYAYDIKAWLINTKSATYLA